MRRGALVVLAGLLLVAGAGAGSVRQATAAQGDASVALADQTTGGTLLTVRSVTLPDGGFVAVRARGDVVGTSAYLAPGTHENVTVRLHERVSSGDVRAVVHRDTNGNRVFEFVSANGNADGPYPDAAATANVTVSAAVRVTDQVSEGRHVVVDRAALSDGGFLVVHDSTLGELSDDPGSLLGYKYIAAGVHRDVRVTLDHDVYDESVTVRVRRDGDDDRRFDHADPLRTPDSLFRTVTGTAVDDAATVTRRSRANVSLADQTSGGARVVVRRAYLPGGGFVALRDGNRTRGVSEPLGPGLHRNVSVVLDAPLADAADLTAVAHRDSDGDGRYEYVHRDHWYDPPSPDPPYTVAGPHPAGGDPIEDAGRVRVAAALSAAPQESAGDAVTVAWADLSDGGFVVASAPDVATGTVRGATLGHSAYLDAGLHHNVTVPLATTVNESQRLVVSAHRDGGGDERYASAAADRVYAVDGDPIRDRAPVTVRATLSVGSVTGGGEALVVDSATLSDGGFLAVRRPSDEIDEPILGHSAYLAPGTYRDVRVAMPTPVSGSGRLVAVAYRDDGDERFDASNDVVYLAGSRTVAASAAYDVPATSTATTRATTRETTTTETTTTTTTPVGGVPGFTLAGAFAALLVIVGFRVRQR